MDVNRIEVEGNLTKDPELKTSKNGQSFAFITVCASYPKGKAPNVEWIPEFSMLHCLVRMLRRYANMLRKVVVFGYRV